MREALIDMTCAGCGKSSRKVEYLVNKPGAPDRESWIRMVENANRAGARTCTYHGAMEAFAQLSRNIFN
jgi:hypothetical protein